MELRQGTKLQVLKRHSRKIKNPLGYKRVLDDAWWRFDDAWDLDTSHLLEVLSIENNVVLLHLGNVAHSSTHDNGMLFLSTLDQLLQDIHDKVLTLQNEQESEKDLVRHMWKLYLASIGTA